jgi:tetratricopeptide (TPR) repeat protein
MLLPGDSLTPTASAQVEGDSLQLLQLVDKLAAELLGESGSNRIDGLDVLAARTTTSLAALKAYLRGEAYFSEAEFPRAVEMFQRAVTLDSGFALAYYKLSEATDWTGEGRRSLQAAEHAYVLRGKLSKQSRLLVEGFRDWRVGNIERAEQSYRELLRWNPASVEARYQLGEVRFHNNPSLGRSVLEARAPFEEALAVDPDDRYALAHLMRLTALARDTVAVDSITRKLAVLEPPGESQLSVAIFRAAALGDTAARADALARLSDASDKLLIDSFERVAVYTGDLDAADSIATLLSQGKHAPENRALGRLYRAGVAQSRGRWRGAQRELRSAINVAPEEGLYAWAFLAATPDAPVSRDELEWLRDSVEELNVEEPDPRTPIDNLRFTTFRQVSRLYILGLLDVRLGDTAAAGKVADEAERIARRGERGEARAKERVGDVDALAEDARSVASGLRGMIAAVGGRHEEAIRLLRSSRPVLSLEFLASYLGARSIERHALAEELAAVGRTSEARRWHDTIAQRFWFEIVFRRP